MMKWIKTEDQLPRNPGMFLVLMDGLVPMVAKFFPHASIDRSVPKCITPMNIDVWTRLFVNMGWDIPEEYRRITHWMEIPELPRTYEEKD